MMNLAGRPGGRRARRVREFFKKRLIFPVNVMHSRWKMAICADFWWKMAIPADFWLTKGNFCTRGSMFVTTVCSLIHICQSLNLHCFWADFGHKTLEFALFLGRFWSNNPGIYRHFRACFVTDTCSRGAGGCRCCDHRLGWGFTPDLTVFILNLTVFILNLTIFILNLTVSMPNLTIIKSNLTVLNEIMNLH